MAVNVGSLWGIAQRRNIPATKIWQRSIGTEERTGASAETVTIDIPTDHFIHAILLKWKAGTLSGGTSPAYNSDAGDSAVDEIRLIGDGNKYFKKLKWKDAQTICIINREPQTSGSATRGYNKLYFSDPKLPDADPLPAWIFTSLKLELDFNALTSYTTGDPTGVSGEGVEVTIIESAYNGEDLSNWRVLIEKYPQLKSYGTSTGEQVYEHERTYKVYGWLYAMADNGTLSNTIFDTISVKGRTRNEEIVLLSEIAVDTLRELNKQEYNNSMPTGYCAVEFPFGLETFNFTSLKSYLNIPSAGTDAQLRVIERYLL